MPQKTPERPGRPARHRAPTERAADAVASRDHRSPHLESPSRSVYGEYAAKGREAA
ncbi:hypothetical protein ABZ642_06370 [Streptomyces sp. NPDC007157]|uniref:hypothetical protein n=1 Tax=Streptomyces sp. NPDC007157 TaxID=3154681 RepID=UPI00340578CB